MSLAIREGDLRQEVKAAERLQRKKSLQKVGSRRSAKAHSHFQLSSISEWTISKTSEQRIKKQIRDTDTPFKSFSPLYCPPATRKKVNKDCVCFQTNRPLVIAPKEKFTSKCQAQLGLC